jgi:hypothetical protein
MRKNDKSVSDGSRHLKVRKSSASSASSDEFSNVSRLEACEEVALDFALQGLKHDSDGIEMSYFNRD